MSHCNLGIFKAKTSSARSSISSDCETDNISAVELQKNRRVLYFSDGTLEEDLSDNEIEVDAPDKSGPANLESEMPLVPRLRHKVHKFGSNLLAGIDYVGGGLASFLGIIPNYEHEVDYYKRSMADAEEGEETWTQRNGASTNNNLNEVITQDVKSAHDKSVAN